MKKLYPLMIFGLLTLTSCSLFGPHYSAKYEDDNYKARFFKQDEAESIPIYEYGYPLCNEYGYGLADVKFKKEGIREIYIPIKVKNKYITKIYSSVFGNDLRRLEKLTIPFIGIYKTKLNTSYSGSVLSIFDNGDKYHTPNSYVPDGFGIKSYWGAGVVSYSYTHYYLPPSLKTIIVTNEKFIPTRSFFNCSTVETIALDKRIIEIGDYAFDNCSNLKQIYFEGSKSEWNKIRISSNGNNILQNIKINFNSDLESL